MKNFQKKIIVIGSIIVLASVALFVTVSVVTAGSEIGQGAMADGTLHNEMDMGGISTYLADRTIAETEKTEDLAGEEEITALPPEGSEENPKESEENPAESGSLSANTGSVSANGGNTQGNNAGASGSVPSQSTADMEQNPQPSAPDHVPEAPETPSAAEPSEMPSAPANNCPYTLWSWIDFGDGVMGFYYPVSSNVNNVNGAWDAQFNTMLVQAEERGYFFQSVADAGTYSDTGSVRVDKYRVP